MNEELKQLIDWYRADQPSKRQDLCESRDIFQGRLDHLFREFQVHGVSNNEAALLISVLGEIGNNAFDHNLGQWHDAPGCLLSSKIQPTSIWTMIADRGQGIRASLARVVPDLSDDSEAIQVAYEKRVSGRAPEQRGNGLKYVRNVLNGNPGRGLFVASGSGHAMFGGRTSEILAELGKPDHFYREGGTFCYLVWVRSP